MRHIAWLFALLPLCAVGADNSWELIEPQPCEGAICDYDYPHFRGYSGSDVGGGYIWWWGGGHKAGPFNSVDAYDISENRWVQFTDAEDIRDAWNQPWEHLTQEQIDALQNTWGGGRGPMYWSPNGRFLTHHSYSWQLWHPDREQFCGLFPYPPEQYPVFACYDPSKGDESGEPAASGTDPTQPDGAFEVVSETVPDWHSSRHGTGLTWDSKRRQVVMTNVGGRGGVWRYDAAADSWDLLTDDLLLHPDGSTFAEGYIDYHPGTDEYFTNRKKQLNVVDAATGEPRRIANPPTDLLTFSLEYSPELDRMLLADQGENGVAEVYAYDPEADAWNKLHLGGQVPQESTFGYDLFDRSQETGQYYLLRRANKFNRQPGVYTVSITEAALDGPETCPVDACVGDAFEFASIQSAVDAVEAGATVGLEDRDYTQCVIIGKPLTLKSLSGRAHIRDRLCDSKAVVVANHANGTVTLETLEVSGGTDAKGIWLSNDAGTLIVRDLKVHDSGMGIFSSPGAELLHVVDSEVYAIDDPNEKAHLVYGAESDRLILENSYVHGGTDGHIVKAQSVDVEIRNSRIVQEGPTDINVIDVWGCGTNVIAGNEIEQANDHIHGIGFTGRTSEDKPCPAGDVHSAEVRDNTYVKNGEQKWSGFIRQAYSQMSLADLTIENNVVDNAWLYRDADQKIAVGDLNGTNTTSADDGTSGDGSTDDGTTDDGTAPQIAITGGMYHVVVGGEEVSDHFQLKEAVQSAVNRMLKGAQDVQITREPNRVEIQ